MPQTPLPGARYGDTAEGETNLGGARRTVLAKRSRWIIAFTLTCALAAYFLPAAPQPIEYHDFADHRTFLGVHNFLDVASNAGFLLVAIAGLIVALRPRTSFELAAERLPYAVFFIGVLLTAAGSAYYHLAPDNQRLFWDRLPMTIAFMALIAAQVADRISVRLGLALLTPLLIVGLASVLYWRATEQAGAGNVVPYGVLQAYAVVMLLLIALSQPSRYTRGNDVYWVFAAYVAAKLFELLDAPVLALDGHLVSGHTLKHVAAAVGGLVVCRMLLLRELQERPTQDGRRPRV
jgi:hypothetical protein